MEQKPHVLLTRRHLLPILLVLAVLFIGLPFTGLSVKFIGYVSMAVGLLSMGTILYFLHCRRDQTNLGTADDALTWWGPLPILLLLYVEKHAWYIGSSSIPASNINFLAIDGVILWGLFTAFIVAGACYGLFQLLMQKRFVGLLILAVLLVGAFTRSFVIAPCLLGVFGGMIVLFLVPCSNSIIKGDIMQLLSPISLSIITLITGAIYMDEILLFMMQHPLTTGVAIFNTIFTMSFVIAVIRPWQYIIMRKRLQLAEAK